MQKKDKKKRKGKLGKQLEAEESQMLDELFGSQQRPGDAVYGEGQMSGNLDLMGQERDDA